MATFIFIDKDDYILSIAYPFDENEYILNELIGDVDGGLVTIDVN